MSTSASRLESSALPVAWDGSWGQPSPFYRKQILELRRQFEEVAEGIHLVDYEDVFSPLVGSVENRSAPVHRWYTYKEAFSYRLPGEVVGLLGTGASRVVADPFAGVATTGLALEFDPRVDCVLGVEYSPFAHFVGQTKLLWRDLQADDLRSRASRLLEYKVRRGIKPPSLAAFSNEEIFEPAPLRSLLSAREEVLNTPMRPRERDFFLLGIAAAIEDVSGAAKDGRALRILRDRKRQQKVLVPRQRAPLTGRGVKQLLASQWSSMIEDLELLEFLKPSQNRVPVLHLKGDARALGELTVKEGPAFPRDEIGLFVYSPPYLNCIDYSEIYKLELWFLEFIRNQEEFRELRLGTLRSHPSIRFPQSAHLASASDTPVVKLIEAVADFVGRNMRKGASNHGPMIHDYFEDMFRCFQDQYSALEPGGWAVCVVANSTFSRREKRASGTEEFWRLPLLTDVLLARLAEICGFDDVQIWRARDLQPRNVRAGTARESLVVMRKPSL